MNNNAIDELSKNLNNIKFSIKNKNAIYFYVLSIKYKNVYINGLIQKGIIKRFFTGTDSRSAIDKFFNIIKQYDSIREMEKIVDEVCLIKALGIIKDNDLLKSYSFKGLILHEEVFISHSIIYDDCSEIAVALGDLEEI